MSCCSLRGKLQQYDYNFNERSIRMNSYSIWIEV